MQTFDSAAAASADCADHAAVAIGNFDGVHLGHQALFRRAIELAREKGGRAIALTFGPHPARFFSPELAPPLINTAEQKSRLIAEQGLDVLIVQPFDRAFAALSPRAFVRQLLVDQLAASDVIVGKSFVFGRRRSGNLHTLQELGEEYGFGTHGLQAVRAGSIVVSSTKVREFILMGRMRGAAALMGRPFSIEGTVVAGAGRGRTLGIPTANLAPENELGPPRGVYAGYAFLDDARHWSVINVGQAPTFQRSESITIEAHLLDFEGDLRARRLRIDFVERLRDEQRFSGPEALVRAIEQDIVNARRLLSSPTPANDL